MEKGRLIQIKSWQAKKNIGGGGGWRSTPIISQLTPKTNPWFNLSLLSVRLGLISTVGQGLFHGEENIFETRIAALSNLLKISRTWMKVVLYSIKILKKQGKQQIFLANVWSICMYKKKMNSVLKIKIKLSPKFTIHSWKLYNLKAFQCKSKKIAFPFFQN